MKITYFKDTDTLLLVLNNSIIADTKDFNEDILLEFDQKGNLVNITIEHASKKANMTDFSYNQIESDLYIAEVP
jgi:uncharacterized protein YuzE